MATVTAIAFNLFETIGLVQPRIEVMVREPVECNDKREPLRMHWVREVDSSGRRVLRIRWSADENSEGATLPAAGSS